MKHLKSLVLVAFMAMGLIANAQKIGHINVEKLLKESPATKALENKLQRLGKTYSNDIDGLKSKYRAKMLKYNEESSSQSQEVNQKRADEMQQEGARIQKLAQEASIAMQKKQQEGLAPILQKAEQAIKDVAAAKGLTYVLDASPGKGVLVFDKGIDIYNDVKAKLGF